MQELFSSQKHKENTDDLYTEERHNWLRFVEHISYILYST